MPSAEFPRSASARFIHENVACLDDTSESTTSSTSTTQTLDGNALQIAFGFRRVRHSVSILGKIVPRAKNAFRLTGAPRERKHAKHQRDPRRVSGEKYFYYFRENKKKKKNPMMPLYDDSSREKKLSSRLGTKLFFFTATQPPGRERCRVFRRLFFFFFRLVNLREKQATKIVGRKKKTTDTTMS